MTGVQTCALPILQFVDDLVVHGAAMLRMRVQKQRQRRIGFLGGVVTAFQAAFWAIENDFGHDGLVTLLNVRCV